MNAWLATIVGDRAAPIVGFVLLFALVIVLLLLVFGILRRLTGGTFVAGGRNRQVRLSVTDAAAVDNRRRLVLVRRDDVEHLILIGGPTDVIVEQNIRQFAKAPRSEPVATAPIAAPEPDLKPEPKPAETPQRQAPQAAPVEAARRPAPQPRQSQPVSPPASSAPEAGEEDAPRIPISPVPSAPVTPSAAPRVNTPAPIAEAAAPMPSIAARDTGTGWEKSSTPAPSFTGEPRPQSPAMPPRPRIEPISEPRPTTAAAFPFSLRDSPPAEPVQGSSLDAVTPAKDEDRVNLGEVDFDDQFDSDSDGELHIAPGKDEAPKKTDEIEDEMERLLGELSRDERR
ncbi:flagellar biosynthetic protein FliO [Phyllobacterium sp. 21LDTY02-6]|uniref:flagellar biosynthetic protein FliO n=1 Tax=Phyllobacterium sp. 21LDTY02-6 TaxID=2944903 RepID=UPI002021085E|nr:flagellar biosynthetic protein FliO [Phyllobacterium sp. 21LDTY02-6]MCO4316212.1 flagellar biosynthetic protein FliO [Phyllobacterium sp. 21LDTY02-6]